MMFCGDSWLNYMQEGLSEAFLGHFAPGRQNAPIIALHRAAIYGSVDRFTGLWAIKQAGLDTNLDVFALHSAKRVI